MEKIRVLTVNQLCKNYGGKPVLKPLVHTFEPGQWTFIIGPNGAGKSTLLKLLACLESPTAGEIRLDECTLAGMTATERARVMAYVPQRLEAVPALTVWEFVCQGAYAWLKLEPDEALQTRATHALEELGLTSYADRRLDTLSGGELQRLKLASHLGEQGRIFIIDEPTDGLHPKDVHNLVMLFEKMVEQGNSIYVIEHNTDVIKSADYVIELGPGAGEDGGAFCTPAARRESGFSGGTRRQNPFQRVRSGRDLPPGGGRHAEDSRLRRDAEGS